MESMFYGSAPLFLITDLATSLDYYCDVLGFDRPHLWGNPPAFAMPQRENIVIMLQQRGEREVRHNQGLWDAYFWVRDVWALFQEFREKGAVVVYEPEIKKFYGCCEFAVRDPDGYTLAFAQETDKTAFFRENDQLTIPLTYTIETERLRLRLPSLDDIPHIFSATRYAGFNDGMLWDPPADEGELIAPYHRGLAARKKGDAYSFSMELKDGGEFIGRLSIRKEPTVGVWNIGFWCHPEKQGRGYTTEAVSAILSFGFKQLGADRIEAGHALWNKASEKVLLRNGFAFDRYIEQGYQKRDSWVAENILAIKEEAWYRRRAGE